MEMEKKRKIWIKNTLLAAFGGLILSLLLVYAHLSGRSVLSDVQAIFLLALFWVGSLLFVYLIVSGCSDRFRDASLTMPQMIWAISTTLLFMSLSRAPAEPYYFLLLIVMIFGVFRLTPGRFYAFAAFTIAALGVQKTLVVLTYEQPPAIIDLAFNWSVFTFSTLILASLCRSMATLRARLKDRNRRLQEALETKNLFLANMSHELRTPINGVIGMLRLLQHTELDKSQQHYVGLAQSSSVSLLTIVNDILDFSKVEAGRLDIESLEFDLRQLISEVAETIAYDAQEKGLEVVLDVSAMTQAQVRSDPIRVRQVLTNLARNAVKFTQTGEIVITASTRQINETKLQFDCAVEDTGIGIVEEKIPTIFESFSQVDATTTREFGGTGLGLAIVKKLCGLLGGNIEVVSRIGEGSRFSVNIAMQMPEQTLHDGVGTGEMESLHILVVDDNASSGAAIKNQLASWGAQVCLAETAAAAMEHINMRQHSDEHVNFNAVLADAQLPDMQGADLCAAIRQQMAKHQAEIILMTAIGQEPSETALSDAMIDSVLFKPVAPTRLSEVLSSQKNRQQNTRVGKYNGGMLQTQKQITQTSIKVLLVEDNLINQEVASGLLETMNIGFDIAANGREAIDKLLLSDKSKPYALILMDCQMPEMDGYQASRNIRSGKAGDGYREIPIVAMTANAMQRDREKCFAAGMSDYLTKPIDIELFEEKLNRWLSKPTDRQLSKNEPITIASDLDTSIWDKPAALRRVKGKHEKLVFLIDLFLKSMPENLEQIKAAAADKRVADVQKLVHGIRGVAANLSAVKLAETLNELEQACKEEESAHIDALFAQVTQDHRVFVQKLKQYLDNFA